jgi:hypothetical protein
MVVRTITREWWRFGYKTVLYVTEVNVRISPLSNDA